MNLSHTTTLVLGDWSNDGHGQTSSFAIRSNLTTERIEYAYAQGVKRLSVDLEEVASEYEDNTISYEDYLKFEAAGFGIEQWELGDWGLNEARKQIEAKSSIRIDKDIFVKLFLYIVAKGDPSFEFQQTPTSAINIGGYGLFYG